MAQLGKSQEAALRPLRLAMREGIARHLPRFAWEEGSPPHKPLPSDPAFAITSRSDKPERAP